MKKRLVLIIATAFLFTALISCSKENEDSELDIVSAYSTSEETSSKVENTSSIETIENETSLPEYATSSIIDDTSSIDISETETNSSEFDQEFIIDLDNKFFEQVDILFGLEYDENVKTQLAIDNHNYTYFKVTDDKYKNLEDILAFLKTLYVYEKAETLYNGLLKNSEDYPPLYTEVDGQLYIFSEYPPRGYESFSFTEDATVEKNSDGTITVNMPYGYYDDEPEGINKVILVLQEGYWVISSGDLWG